MMDYISPEFKRKWECHFDITPPLMHILRHKYVDRWVRFHSFSDDHAFIKSSNEMHVAIHKYRKISENVIADGESVWIALSYANGEEFGRRGPPRVTRGALPLVAKASTLEGEDEYTWSFYGKKLRWSFEGHLQLWREIAAGRTGAALAMCSSTGAIFSPYEGGVDVIAATIDQAATLRSSFQRWIL